MNIIDTHAHLFACQFDNDIDEVVSRAKKSGVTKVLLPNIDATTIDALKETFNRYPDFFIPMMGIHPTSVKDDWQEQLQCVENELQKTEYKAVGEIGIDLYWSREYKQQQIEVFETQLSWSKDMQVPVSVHSRDALFEVVTSIQKIGQESLFGVFHSFGGIVDDLELILPLANFYIGINGVVTFKNSGLTETLRHVSLDRLVLETDSPYLAPMPYRGKRNEPSYLVEILEKLAQIYSVSKEEVAHKTTRNAIQLFGIINGEKSKKN